MSARSRALIPLSAEQQAAMQAVAVTEQRRRQGRTLSAWPYASAFFRCLNGSRRISLTDLRFFAPALTKEEFHGNRLLWLAAVDKLIETHIMRLLISLWDVGTVFFTIYPQVFRHEKSSIYYKYIEPLSYCLVKSVFFPCHPMRGIVCSRPFLFVKVSGVVRKPR